MRKLTPVHVAASVVIAIAGTSAFAQAPRIGMAPAVTPAPSSGTGASTGAVFKPSKTAGTGGSANPNGSGAIVNNNGTGTDNTGGFNTGTGTNSSVIVNPLLIDGMMAGGIIGPSDSVADNSGLSNNQGYASSINAGVAADDTARTSASLDRVIKQAERDRKKAGRNGQLLYSIAPRTGVDRSGQMPDDGPTPALKGLTPGGLSRQ
jgi:hypothetical protein